MILQKPYFYLELKSTKSTSIPLSMIRQNQIEGLLKASSHNLKAGFIVNFRNKNNDTFFITIGNFNIMINSLSKKSFNVSDLENFGAIRIYNELRRTRYRYNINELISEVIIYD